MLPLTHSSIGQRQLMHTCSELVRGAVQAVRQAVQQTWGGPWSRWSFKYPSSRCASVGCNNRTSRLIGD